MPVETLGFDRAMTFLDDMPEFVQASADKIMGAGAELLSVNAKAIVPVRTGRLQKSIQVTKVGSCLYLVGSDLYYAGFVEFGTSHMRAQPYLRPAWDMTQPRVIGSIASMIDQLKSEFLL